MFGLGWTARPTFFYDVQSGQFVTGFSTVSALVKPCPVEKPMYGCEKTRPLLEKGHGVSFRLPLPLPVQNHLSGNPTTRPTGRRHGQLPSFE